MPTYEFRCPNGHEFERFYRKISDAAAELPCPTCGKVAVRQLSGGAGLLFKGSGFYLTDYGKNAHRKAAPAAPSSGGGESAPTGESASSESSSTKSDAGSEKPKDAGKKATGAAPPTPSTPASPATSTASKRISGKPKPEK
jgi:putative FmdB family regulatory protein